MGIFGKDKKKKDVEESTPTAFHDVGSSKPEEESQDSTEKKVSATPKALPKEYGVLKGFYVSEKAASLNVFNQYVFKIFKGVNKNEVRKQVEKSFDVKVKGVKIINLPRKKRRIGRHSGFKSGIKKAIVILKKGDSIEGFQP